MALVPAHAEVPIIDGTGAAERPRKLQRVSTEVAVESMLYQHFRSWAQETVCGRTVDGKTLRQRLTIDQHRRNRGERVVMNKAYFKNLQMQYGGSETAIANMKPDFHNESVPDVLLRAMAGAQARTPKYDLMLEFLNGHVDENFNSTCAAGIFKWALGLVPSDKKTIGIATAVMRWVHRNSLLIDFPNQCIHMVDWFDMTMLEQWTLWRKANKKLSEFIIEFLDPLALLMDPALLRQVAEADMYLCIANEIKNLAVGSKIGVALFGDKVLECVWEEIESEVNGACVHWIHEANEKMGEINFQEIEQMRSELHSDLLRKFELHKIKFPQKATLQYRDDVIKVVVYDWYEYTNQAIWTMVKHLAVRTNMLEKLPFEDLAVEPDGITRDPYWPALKLKWFAPVLRGIKAARKQMVQVLEANYDHQSMPPAEYFVREINKVKHELIAKDPYCRLELSLLHKACDGDAAGRLHAHALQAMPSAMTSTKTMPDTLQGLHVLTRTNLAFILAPKEAQNDVQYLIQIIGAMVNGQEPNFGTTINQTFLAHVKNRLMFYVRDIDPATNVQVCGAEALKIMFNRLRTNWVTDGDVKESDLMPFRAYAWLLDEATRKGMNTMLKDLLPGADVFRVSSPKSRVTSREVDMIKGMQEAMRIFFEK